MASRRTSAESPRETWGYIRVSTEDQATNGYGLAAQEDSVRSYCQAMGYELAGIIHDDGQSGFTMERPGLQEVCRLAGSGRLARVVVYKLDRISRRLRDILNLVEGELEPAGASIVSVKEQFDTSSPTGRLMFQLLGSFAEFERSLITARTMDGRKRKASEGGYAGGQPGLGYRARRGTGALEVDEEKAATVRRCLELRDAHPDWSLRQLADAINQEGHTTAQGKRFTAMQVKRVLDRRPLYEGRAIQFAGVEGESKQPRLV